MSFTLDVSGGKENEPTVGRGLDAAAFAVLYEQHREAVRRFCRSRTHDRTLVDDIVQDVFERAFACRDRFDPQRRFWPWVAAIAVRACIDAHRRSATSEARHDQYGRATHREPFDTTSTAVLDAIDQRSLGRQIAALPPRQRAALGLFALDGWSYEDIGRHLGHSATAVKALIRRARSTLRETTGRWVAAGVGLARSVRTRLHALWARVQTTVWPSFDSVGVSAAATAWSGASAVLLAIVMATAALAPAVADGSRHPLASPRPASPGSPREHGAPVALSAAEGDDARQSPPLVPAVAGTAEAAGTALVASALPGSAGPDSPETIHATSFAQSPDDDDPTVFVAGRPIAGDVAASTNGASVPLLVSHDDASSWQRRQAVGLAPVTRLVLPPTYPRDARVFAITAKGLQVSHDDGHSFVTLLAMAQLQEVAFSPEFGTGGSSLALVVGDRLWWSPTETGPPTLVRLAGPIAPHLVASVGFVADQADGRTILLGTRLPNGSDAGLHVSRCLPPVVADITLVASLDCETVELPNTPAAEVPLRLSPHFRSGVLFVPFESAPLVSVDGGRTYRPARPEMFSDGMTYRIHDLAPVPSRSGEAAIVAQTTSGTRAGGFVFGPQLARTDDGGRTWTSITVDLPNFFWAERVVVTPSGRIVAAGGTGGLGCSSDGGRTWARTCAP